MKTDNFRRQHKDLLAVAGELGKHLTTTELSANAKPAAQVLSQLSGKLNVHLGMEDNSLYPNLLKHEDAQVRSTAQHFIDDMKGIANAYKMYAGRWSCHTKIQADPQAFIAETKGIFKALADRIEREDNRLYKLVDDLVHS
jgi:hypothetical protein